MPKLSETVVKPVSRVSTGVPELNRILGGGLPRGDVVLLAGGSGVGKTTLLLQAVTGTKGRFLSYGWVFADEERRLGVGTVDTVPDLVQARMLDLDLLVVDDYQDRSSSISMSEICKFAAVQRVAVVCTVGLTKAGDIRGEKEWQHLAGAVLRLSRVREGKGQSGEGSISVFRVMTVEKSRFSSADSIEVLEMTDRGFRSLRLSR